MVRILFPPAESPRTIGSATAHLSGLYTRAGRVALEPMNIDFGVQVLRPFEPEGDVRCIATPGREVAKTVHVGPYDRLSDAHNAIHAWCAANNGKIAQASWETYADWTEDPALLETTIKYLLA